jgi:ketosteroid isomerase-like protein
LGSPRSSLLGRTLIVMSANPLNLEALVSHYDDRAVLMAANRPTATGADAIREDFLAEWEAAEVQVSGEVDEAHISGDFAMLRGSWTATITPSDGSPPFDDTGSFVEVYRRQDDGSWRSVWDIWNSELPLPS